MRFFFFFFFNMAIKLHSEAYFSQSRVSQRRHSNFILKCQVAMIFQCRGIGAGTLEIGGIGGTRAIYTYSKI